jgi:plasmid stabilization system protein ParE
LRDFPRLGPELPGRWQGYRFILGPWRWLIIVYALLEGDGRVVVVTIQDARSATGATEER